MYFKYFQPNEKDEKGEYGDCAIRAICKAENLSWQNAYELMYNLSKEIQCPMNIKPGFEYIVKYLGYSYGKFKKLKKGEHRKSVKEFAKTHQHGIYICNTACHYVTIYNGHYYDSWDSGDKYLYSYWYKEA